MLIDSHCHLPSDITVAKEILKRAHEEGVEKVINIGTSLKRNKVGINLATNIEGETKVYTTIAIYPHDDKDIPTNELKDLLEKQLTESDKIVGIGECGIDVTAWTGGRSLNEQIELFEMQIQLAIENELPLIIHNRNGEEEVLELLQKYVPKGLKGVAHCFTQSWEYAKKLLDLDFYISFSGFVTHNSKAYLLETVKNIPSDKFLIETDSPYILPKGAKDKQKEPKNVKIIALKIAQTRNTSFEEIAQKSYKNTKNLFGI